MGDPLKTWCEENGRFANASSTKTPGNWWKRWHYWQVHQGSIQRVQQLRKDTTPKKTRKPNNSQTFVKSTYFVSWSKLKGASRTFFIWNLMVALTSSIFWVMDSWWVRSRGNLPALFKPGPNRRGICLISDSLAKKASYFLAVTKEIKSLLQI